MPRRTDYQSVAKSLIAHEMSGQPVIPLLKQLCPELVTQIQLDTQHRPLLNLWGKSVNFDEFAGSRIVSPGIMSAIGDLAGMTCDGAIIHAGLQHTYGYLLSVIETPFGFKRDRWINDTIEAGFGIDQPSLRPWPSASTMMLNVTYFLGRIAFRGMSAELALLRRHEDAVAAKIVNYPFRQLRIGRITEDVSLPQDGSHIQVHSDFVKMPQANSEPRFLMIYSILDEREARGSLITAFPVTRDALDDYCSSDSFGDQIPLRTRFNAFVDGWTGTTLHGQRMQVDSAG